MYRNHIIDRFISIEINHELPVEINLALMTLPPTADRNLYWNCCRRQQL